MDSFNPNVIFHESDSSITAKIRNMGVDADCHIICDNVIFPAHRAVLGSCSNHLLEQFLKRPNDAVNFIAEDAKPKDVECLLEYIYASKAKKQPTAENHSRGFIALVKQFKLIGFSKNDRKPKVAKSSPLCKLNKALVDELSKSANSQSSGQSSSAQMFVFKKPLLPKPKGLSQTLLPLMPIYQGPEDTYQTPENDKMCLRRNKKVHKDTPTTKTSSEENMIVHQTGFRVDRDRGAPSRVPLMPLNGNQIRKGIGRPLLSSTKLDPHSPIIHDMGSDKVALLKKLMKANGNLIETLPTDGSVEGGSATFPVPTSNERRFQNITVRKRRDPELPVAVQPKRTDEKVESTNEVVSNSILPLASNSPRFMDTDMNNESSGNDSAELKSSRKVRRKLPGGKRRRIPASTRPVMINSTLDGTTFDKQRPRVSVKLRAKRKRSAVLKKHKQKKGKLVAQPAIEHPDPSSEK